MAEAPFYLTDEALNDYYQSKLDSGVSLVSVRKYREALVLAGDLDTLKAICTNLK